MNKLRILVLALALGALPAAAEESADPAAGLPHAFVAGWQGQQTCQQLYEDASVRIGQCTFPPGVGHEKHYHNPHFGYVLAGGTLEIFSEAGQAVITTDTGDTWSTVARTVHHAVNIGDTTTSYLIVEPKGDAP